VYLASSRLATIAKIRNIADVLTSGARGLSDSPFDGRDGTGGSDAELTPSGLLDKFPDYAASPKGHDTFPTDTATEAQLAEAQVLGRN
jgi:hypothetical protein